MNKSRKKSESIGQQVKTHFFPKVDILTAAAKMAKWIRHEFLKTALLNSTEIRS